MEMSTLHEICVKLANKQPGMIDALTEDAPIMRYTRFKPSTHGLWDVSEKLDEVTGPAFVEADAPLPTISTSSSLVHTDLHVMGGTMEVPTQRALKFGGPAKYFAEKQPVILRKAGMDTEIQLVLKNWLKGARAAKNLKNAGGTSKGWFLLAVRFDEHENVGLYDPDQFEQGKLFKITSPYNASEHLLHGQYEGVYGYAVIYRANFGWKLQNPGRTCSAIVNIDEEHMPTANMIDDMLADVRAQPGSTYIFCGPRAKIYGINPHKRERVQLANSEKDVNTYVETWTGIPIIVSHNFSEKIANIAAGTPPKVEVPPVVDPEEPEGPQEPSED